MADSIYWITWIYGNNGREKDNIVFFIYKLQNQTKFAKLGYPKKNKLDNSP